MSPRKKLTIDELVKQSHETAKEKGWWDKPRRPLEVHALITTEIAEATEAVRRKQPDVWLNGEKPNGELVELADAIIRIADYCGYRGWDLEGTLKMKLKFNRTRPYRHGGKRY